MSKVKLGDVANEIRETTTTHEDDCPVVALEYLHPGEITLKEWTTNGNNTFTKRFHKGQVLFGRRRAYLKKAALAPFDGICSGDITVIEAKAERLLPELLPFIIQNDAFFDYAVGKSAGSLSPRVKWEHLKEYEFSLPGLEEQHKLANILWAMDRVKNAYKNLIAKTDELVKSQFNEMFGDPEYNTKHFKKKALGELFKISSSKRILQAEQTKRGVPFLRISDLMQKIDGQPEGASLFISEDRFADLKKTGNVPIAGDILITSRGTLGRCYVVQSEDRFYFQDGMISWLSERDESITNTYLVTLFQHSGFRKQIDRLLAGSTVSYLSIAMLKKLKVILPSLSLQNQFASFIAHLDKSKFALEKALGELQAQYKMLLKEHLG